MSVPLVYLCAGDETGWAIDEDRRLTAEALAGVAALVDTPAEADVIHANWWMRLVELPADAIGDKPVVCHMVGEVSRVLAEPMFARALDRVTHWCVPSRSAGDDLSHVAARVSSVPYAIDPLWFEAATEDAEVAAARATLPDDAFVVASVHRDTAGADIASNPVPKLDKGPDAWVEVLAALRERGVPAAALLAGPRRHWMRRALTERGVPWAFVGEQLERDDYPRNTVSPERVRSMLASADAVLCTSRSEGGPRTVLESASAGVLTLSTRVGHAEDLLARDCVVRDPIEMVDRVAAHYARGALAGTIEANLAIAKQSHSVDAAREALRAVYANLGGSSERRVGSVVRRATGSRIGLWNNFQPPPWSGGNQFIVALEAELGRQGYETVRNGPADAHIVNSVQFPREQFDADVDPRVQRVVHRIGGPISVLRGTPESLKQYKVAMRFNSECASATVIQSRHTLRFLAELGWHPVRPTMIRHAADPEVFFAGEPRVRDADEPVRVIATCWSPSPGKGAAVYAWLAAHLDRAKYQLTFVGNLPPGVEGVRVIEPVGSVALGDLLRESDVYITASRNDPCGNALVEALSCGLPAIYYDGGGHPELAGFGGLPFTRPEQVPMLLDRLMDRYDAYRRMIRVESMADVARRYAALALDDRVYMP